MPCHYYTLEQEDALLRQSSPGSERILIEQVNQLTRLLCEATKHITTARISSELRDWIEDHDELDRREGR